MFTTISKADDDLKNHGTAIDTRAHVICALNKMYLAAMLFVFTASSGLIAFAQQDSGAVRLSGSIMPALKLTFADSQSTSVANGWSAVIESASREFAQIRFQCSDQAEATQISIPFEIRTNVDYRLKLTLVSSSGSPLPIGVSTDSVRPSGDRVMPDAASNCLQADISDLTKINAPAAILSGTRVSAGGNFIARTNALLVNLNLSLPQHQGQGQGQVVIRLSLEQSS